MNEMTKPNYESPAQRHLRLDSLLRRNSFVDLRDRYQNSSNPRDRFLPTGILLHWNPEDANGVTASIRGTLWGDENGTENTFILATNVVHPLRFRRIYAQGTTAGGIIIVGQ